MGGQRSRARTCGVWRVTLCFVALLMGTGSSNRMLAGPAGRAEENRRIEALLEPIRSKYHLPALAGAIVTSQGLTAIGATGVRSSSTKRLTKQVGNGR